MKTIGMLAVIALAGCGMAEEERFGTIDLPVTAQAGGNTYRLPQGSRLQLVGANGYLDQLDLDGDGDTRAFNVPPGEYEVSLWHPNGFVSVWPLERRAADGSTDTVYATLMTASATAVIIENQTTHGSFAFQVAHAGQVSFSHGTIEVTVGVDEVEATLISISGGGGSFDSVITTAYAGLPASLAAVLPGSGATDVTAGWGMDITGPWVETGSETVCAPAKVYSWSSSNAGIEQLIQEGVQAQDASVCVYRQGGNVLARLHFDRVAPATTALYADASADIYVFMGSMLVFLPESVFDGETLDLAALEGSHTYPGAMYFGIAGSTGLWYEANLAGPIGFSLFPAVN